MLGGIGNLRGALLGGLLLGVMENYGQVVFGTEWRDVVAFALLIIVLMFRPTGILGESWGGPAHEHLDTCTRPAPDGGRPTTMPPAGRVTTKDRPHSGVGDRLRLWWDAQARPTQWAIGVPFLIFLALVPILNIPVLATVGTNFGGVMAQFGMMALIAIGLYNVVVGEAGLLDLGYVGFYAIGAYTVAILTSPDSPWNQTDEWLWKDWAWLAALPIAVAITSLSGLILGSPTLRLRGQTTSPSWPLASARSSASSRTTSTS